MTYDLSEIGFDSSGKTGAGWHDGGLGAVVARSVFHLNCHSPRRRGIQYPRDVNASHDRRGVLDRPLQCAIAHKAGDDTETAKTISPADFAARGTPSHRS